MKIESTNITIVANEATGLATIGQVGRTPAFIDYKHLEELRDLLNDFYESLYGTKTADTAVFAESVSSEPEDLGTKVED